MNGNVCASNHLYSVIDKYSDFYTAHEHKRLKLTIVVCSRRYLTYCISVQGGLISGLILGLHPVNERRRCIVTTSLFGWVQA